MGVNIRELIPRKTIDFPYLSHKIVAIDAFNLLYQMLTTIRQRDGTPLTDNQGNITSHLVGLFSRTTHFLEKGIKPVFVFDGKAPDLKQEERARRKELKEEALAKYRVAKDQEDIEDMKKYASRTATLTKDMITESQELLKGFSIPIVQAPSEGEAQAAYMAKKGDAYAVVSQDYDSLLYGTPLLVHNLSVAGKRKKTKVSYEKIQPEIISLSEVLNTLSLDQDQLIALAMLIGTDYNRGGIKGIGPKHGLKLVKEHGKDFDKLFAAAQWDDHCSTSWKTIFDTFKHMPTTDDYDLSWGVPDAEQLTTLLVDKHDFSLERIKNALEKLHTSKTQQKGLGEFM